MRRFGRDNKCHFKRTYLIEEVDVIGADVSKAYTFGLGKLPNNTEFNSLFQAYRCNKVVVNVVPMQNIQTGTTGGTAMFPRIVSAIDFNDDNAGASFAELLEYSRHRVHKGWEPFSRKFTPAIEGGLLGSAAAVVAGVQKFKQWIDIAAFDAKHFGLKIHWNPPTQNTFHFKYSVYATLYFSCKQLS